ncbi:hypothetical protein [Acinetobacter ursingii]|uniref:hypothetical protein n=1 Tax=Acinetobacter ursingii TaxID=108980 RepID=UPI00254E321E|nr:hypothetical protein [Acinetobacter ursingii]MEC6128072.1 hypothetical protein [Acinetobacter ursingii]
MDTQQVSDYVNNIKIPAPQLLSEIDPNLSKRFQRALNGLDKLINEIREHYLEALNIYLAIYKQTEKDLFSNI